MQIQRVLSDVLLDMFLGHPNLSIHATQVKFSVRDLDLYEAIAAYTICQHCKSLPVRIKSRFPRNNSACGSAEGFYFSWLLRVLALGLGWRVLAELT